MECDALFAESDDDVEVIPSSSDARSTTTENTEPSPNPVISSNYVNSTSPNPSYDVNVTPLAPPASSHTPVPEEYQPLPDSSSSLEYVLAGNGADNTNSSGQRFPDINIRYQPKPFVNHHRGYYYPNYNHYGGGARPAREYVITPYHTNNVIVLGEDQAYAQHHMPYAMPPAHSQMRENMMAHAGTFDNIPLEIYGEIPASSDEHVEDVQQARSPERPSRKLNISPRTRNSKDNETNLIEVSSEDEDTAATSQILPNENDDTNQVSVNDDTPTTSGNGRPYGVSRIDIKREPHDQCEVATQAAGDADSNRGTQQLQQQQPQHVCGRRVSQSCSHMPIQIQHGHHHDQNIGPRHIKPENMGCPNSHSYSCADNGYIHTYPNPNAECVMHGRHYNYHNGSHNQHYLHHHRHIQQCPHNSGHTSGGSNTVSHVKEEPSAQPQPQMNTNVKQEISTPQTPKIESVRVLTTACGVKTESVELPQVKIERRVQSPARNIEISGNVNVKSEGNNPKRRSHDIDAAGDRKVKISTSSPQPGTSSGRNLPHDDRTVDNYSQVIDFFNVFSYSCVVLTKLKCFLIITLGIAN